MRETSREPTLSDSARWLGAEWEARQPFWWQEALEDVDLTAEALARLGSQLMYMRRVGVEIDRNVLAAAIEEAVEHGGEAQKTLAFQVEPIEAEVIYYLRVGHLVKIGYTSNLTRRLGIYPPDSVLLATEPGDRGDETRRHRQFAKCLARGREWFFPGADLVRHINSLRDEPLTSAQLAA